MPGKKDKRTNAKGTRSKRSGGRSAETTRQKQEMLEQKAMQQYLEPAQRIEQARPFWESVTPEQRKELLEIPVEKLLDYMQASLQMMEHLGAPDSRTLEEFAQILETGIRRQKERETWKRWVWHGREFASAEEFRDHLARVAKIHPGKACAGCGATTILGSGWKVTRGEKEQYLCGDCKEKEEKTKGEGLRAEPIVGIPPIQERQSGKEKEQPAEAALRERMKELITYVHDSTRSFQEEHRQRNERTRRHRDLDIDESREANISHIQHMLNMLSREQDTLYNTCLVPIQKFAASCATKIDGRGRTEQELFSDLEILPYEDINRIYDFLLEKIETFTVKQGDPEEEEKEMGDIDLFAVSEDGKSLFVHPKWLQHLEERKLGEDGQPQRMDQEELEGMQGAALGLVLEWIYGSIICTAEKAREVARRTLSDDLPPPSADACYMSVVQQQNMMYHWQTMVSRAKELLARMLENRKFMGDVDKLKEREEHTQEEVLQLLRREELLTQAKIEMLSFKHWAGEKEAKKMRTQLAVKEPQYQRLKLELEEAKTEKFKTERGKGDGHGHHRNSEAVMQEHMELQTALQESTMELKRIQASLTQLQHDQNHRSQEITQLNRSWLGQIGNMIAKLEGKPRTLTTGLEKAAEESSMEDESDILQQKAAVRSVMKQFRDDVKKQLYSAKEDLEVFNGIKEGIRNMERYMEDGLAVLSHLQTQLLNVSCDDVGAVIGGSMCLPYLQDKLDSAALEHAAAQAAEAEAAVIALEQEEELRKNAEKMKKEKQKMKRKQKERDEREQKLAAEREALAKKQAEEEEARIAAQKKDEEDRIQREIERQERLKEEERLRELRKQQLLAEEGGYWKLRVEQELKEKAVYKETEPGDVDSEEDTKIPPGENGSSDSGWESTGKNKKRQEKATNLKKNTEATSQDRKPDGRDSRRVERSKALNKKELTNGFSHGRAKDQVKKETSDSAASIIFSEDSRTSSSSSSTEIPKEAPTNPGTGESSGENVPLPGTQVPTVSESKEQEEFVQEPDPCAGTDTKVSSSTTVEGNTENEGKAKAEGPSRPTVHQPVVQMHHSVPGPAPVFGSLGVPPPVQMPHLPPNRGMFFMPPQHGMQPIPVPMGAHMPGMIAPGMPPVLHMPHMYPIPGHHGMPPSIHPQSVAQMPKNTPAKQLSVGAKPFIPSRYKEKSGGKPQGGTTSPSEQQVPTMRLITKDKPLVPALQKEGVEGEAAVVVEENADNAKMSETPVEEDIPKSEPAGSLASSTSDLPSSADMAPASASSIAEPKAKAKWAAIAARESSKPAQKERTAATGGVKSGAKPAQPHPKTMEKTHAMHVNVLGGGGSDATSGDSVAVVRSRSGAWKRAGKKRNAIHVDDLPDDAIVGTGLVNKSGDFNCFLNVIIQSLWHLEDFRRELLRVKPTNGTTETPEQGVVKALQNVFYNISQDARRGSENNVVDPTELRDALSRLYEGSKLFRKNEMNDASEVLAVLFECICKTLHRGKDGGEIFVHKLFGLGGGWFFHIVFSEALKKTVETNSGHLSTDELLLETEKSLNGGKLDTFGSALHIAGDKFPNIFTLVIAWHTAHASCEDIQIVANNLGEYLDVAKILGKQSRPEEVHRLRSVVCFRGSHYHAYVRSEKLDKWLLFDDTTIRQVGTWQNVKDSCISGQIQPSVLFYELLA